MLVHCGKIGRLNQHGGGIAAPFSSVPGLKDCSEFSQRIDFGFDELIPLSD